jgi:group I intron endonuclease
MKLGVIYKITSPSGRYYIGKTINLNGRLNNYKNHNNKEQRIIYNSILKYGWENHVFEILGEFDVNVLSEMEIKFIEKYNSFQGKNPNGMNLTLGGEGAMGRVDSDEVKLKRSQKHVGLKRSDETKKLMSEKKKGKVPSCSSLPRSEKQLYHIKYGNIGRKKSEESSKKEMDTKLKNFIKKYGSILQYDLNNNLIKEWIMLPSQISKKIKKDSSQLLRTLKDENKKCNGFYWKYKIKQN